MGTVSLFEPERLVIALLYRPDFELGSLASELDGRFGKAEFLGTELPFTWTDYYGPEMGPGLRRCFCSFGRLIDPSELADIKLWTNGLEERLSFGGKRTVNLDPGFLSLGRFCLATTKDRSHRIPLGRGIYAELTLIYEAGDWRPLPWTYADWRSPEYRAVLTGLRERYKAERRTGFKR